MIAVTETPTVATASEPVRQRLSLGRLMAVSVAGGLAVLSLWFAGYVLVIGAGQEQGDQERAFATLRAQLAQAIAPLGPSAPGTPLAIIEGEHLPRAVVLEGAAARDLQSGPGHRRDTVLPGQVGTCVLYGKAATFGAPFKHVPEMHAGDRIDVTTAQGSFTYRVTGLRRGGELEPASPTGVQGRLTLVTLTGSGWRASIAPTRVVYVDALLDKAQPASGRRVLPVAGEGVLDRTDDALLPLVLWLQALLVVIGAAVWGWARWGRWQSWLVASPVLVAVLIGVSRTAAQLLPNLL